jgi:hypothetical protein
MCAAQLLGFDNFIPPFAATSGDQLLGGANFASAAAGIRAETGQQLGGRIPFAGQVQNYQTAVQTLVGILGDQDTASDHLSRCIFSVGMGSNDYLNNYFMPAFYNTGSRYTPEQYADSLIADYRRYLQVLYNYGARKVVLIGVGQVGCSPNELARYSADGVTCVDRIDGAIQIFNRRLVGLVDEFNALPGAHFTYINAYNIFDDILANAASYGTVANAALMTIYFRFPSDQQCSRLTIPWHACRVHGDERGVLRGGEEQRAGDVPAVPGAVRQQGRAHLLGRVPPVGGGQHRRRPAILPRRVAQRRLSHGHQHARLHLIHRQRTTHPLIHHAPRVEADRIR